VLSFEGCPHTDRTIDLVRRVASLHGLESRVEHVRVRDRDEMVALRFLGSPTVQIDGIDIEPSARDRTDFGMGCRLYGRSGVPAEEALARAIRDALARTPESP